METGKKVAIGATLVAVLVVGGRWGMLVHQRHAEENAPVVSHAEDWKKGATEDSLVFLKKKRPGSLKDVKELDGTRIWVSAGGQMEYYPVVGHRAVYGKPAGTLLGAQAMEVKDAIEQGGAPKAATFRIPGGDKQVLLVFTMPGGGAGQASGAGPGSVDGPGSNAGTEYAVPVGYKQGGDYTFYTDELFFYDDPHELYKHWGPKVWAAVDAHRAELGMSEAEVQMALGQVSKSVSEEYGNRMVVYPNLGHPKAVTFVKDKATAVRDDQGY